MPFEDPQVDLNYTIKEYPVGFNAARLDSWYISCFA